MDARDRLAAALALIAFNQETDVVIDSLIAVVSSPYRYETRSTSYPGEARPEAAKVLGDLAPASKKAIPALAEVLGSEVSADLRLECAIALSKFGREAESAVPALKRYVTPRYTPHASDGPVREAAAEALRKIAPDEVK
jgi:HEAT repeat protein